VIGNPLPLKQNAGKSYQGNIVLGKGFILSPEEARSLIAKDPRNKDVLFPYLNGEDLNGNPEQAPSRWVINFFDWPEDKARSYPDCFEIVERLVKPERETYDEAKNSWNKFVKKNWWQFGAWRKNLDETISKLDQVMVINRYTKYVILDFQPTNIVFSDSIVVFSLPSNSHFALLSSILHDVWSWKNSSTMGVSTLRYSASKAFETFSFYDVRQLNKEYETMGEEFYLFRKKIMQQNNIGLTDLYNMFHSNKLSNFLTSKISALRKWHIDIDQATLSLYDWQDIELKHDFYEVEYLPDGDRTRYTIHPNARKEILKRLLQLNQSLTSPDSF
jgi:hypothetical protein